MDRAYFDTFAGRKKKQLSKICTEYSLLSHLKTTEVSEWINGSNFTYPPIVPENDMLPMSQRVVKEKENLILAMMLTKFQSLNKKGFTSWTGTVLPRNIYLWSWISERVSPSVQACLESNVIWSWISFIKKPATYTHIPFLNKHF